MRDFGLEFHHFRLGVQAPDEAVVFLSNLRYVIGDKVFDPEQNVNLILCRHRQMPTIEIIYPGNTQSYRHLRGPTCKWHCVSRLL